MGFRAFWHKWFAALPIPLLLLVISGLWIADVQIVYTPQPLMLFFTALLSAVLTSLVIVKLTACFVESGMPELLLLDCGILLLGLARLAGVAMLGYGVNATVSTQNILMGCASLLHMAAGILVLKPHTASTARKHWAFYSLLGTLLLAFLIIAIQQWGILPIFFIQGSGGSELRQLVIGAAIMMFVGTAAIMLSTNRPPAFRIFGRWYGFALLLMAVSLLAQMFQDYHDSALHWVGRLAQLLGWIYLLLAVLRLDKHAALSTIPVPQPAGAVLGWLRKQTPLGLLFRFNLAVVMMLGAMGLRLGLSKLVGSELAPYMTVYPAIMLTALLAGFGPGFVVTVLSGFVIAHESLPPIGLFAITSPGDRLAMVFFIGMGTLMSLVVDLYQHNRDKADAYVRESLKRENEARLTLFATATFEGILETESGRIVDCNEQLGEMLGYTPEELKGMQLKQLLSTDDVEQTLMHFSMADAWSGEHGMLCKDGTELIVESHCRSVNISGNRRHIAIRNITERKRIELVLQETRHRKDFLADILETSSQAFAIGYPDGSLAQYNKAFEQLTGYSSSELKSIDWCTVLTPLEWREYEAQKLAELQLTCQPVRYEKEYIRKDGSKVAIELLVHLKKAANGTPEYYYSFITDISERKQAEAARYESEKRFRDIANASADWLWEIDQHAKYCFASGRVKDLLGYEPEEIVGKSPFDLMPAGESLLIRQRFQEIVAQQLPFRDLANINLHKDGSIRYILTSGVPVVDKQGRVQGYRGVDRDVTALKTAELERQKFVSLSEQSNEFIGMCNLDLAPFYLNQAGLKLVGLEELPDDNKRTILDFFYPRDHDFITKIFLPNVLRDGRDEVEIQFRHFLTGEPIWVIHTAFLIKNLEGHPVGLATVSRDIRHLKQLQEELEQRVDERTRELATSVMQLKKEVAERIQAEKTLVQETEQRLQAVEALRMQERMLIQQNRHAAMGEMIGNIAHQWRQPLNTLGLYTQRLAMFYDTPEFTRDFVRTSVAKSMEIIQYMSKTIDDFRYFFLSDRKRVTFKASDAVNKVLTLLEASFHENKIRTLLEKEDDPNIVGFPNEYAQALLNICINAKDALIERAITSPWLKICITSHNGQSVVLLSDNAGGIDEALIDKIFDPYFTTKGLQHGTGIGLFMSRTIIENNMGGRLTVRNTEVGAEFRIEV